MRRIIFFAPGLHEPGGCATHGRRLLAELEDAGADIVAVTRAATERRPRLDRTPTSRVVEVPGFSRRLGAMLYVLVAGLAGIAFGRKRDIVALQLGSPTLVAGFVSKIWRRPLIVMSTSTGPNGEIREAQHSRFRSLHLGCVRHASVRVAQTEEGRAEFESVAPGAMNVVVPNPAPRADARTLSGEPRVAFAGRLSKQKNLECLLDAWRLVIEKYPAARLTLIGAGGEYDSVEQDLRHRVSANPRLAETVTFTGWVPDAISAMADSDVFVLPSHHEGLSNALLEACASGRVVVASAIPSHQAFLGAEYPLLASPEAPDDLADALIRGLTDDDVRQQAVRLTRDRVRQMSSNSAGERILALLDD